MSDDNFKNEVLEILGLSANINPPKDDTWIKNSSGETIKNISANKNYSSSEVQSIVRKMIDNKISNEIEGLDVKAKKEKYNKLNNSLKSFSLDDILHFTKGFDIGKGFLKAKEDDISKDGDEGRASKLGVVGDIKKEGEQGTIGVWYSVRNPLNIEISKEDIGNKEEKDYLHKSGEKYSFRRGDLILALYTKNKFKRSSPAQTLEDGIHSILGGKKNPGSSDSVKDLEAGMDISVKCYSYAEKPNYGSANALAKYDREVKLLMYRYNYIKSKATKKLFGNNNYQSFVHCRLDNEHSGFIKDGYFYKTEEEMNKANPKNNRVSTNKKYASYKALIDFLKKLADNPKNKNALIQDAIKRYIGQNIKNFQFSNKSDFKGIYADLGRVLNQYVKENSENKRKYNYNEPTLPKIDGLDEIKNNILPKEKKQASVQAYFNY